MALSIPCSVGEWKLKYNDRIIMIMSVKKNVLTVLIGCFLITCGLQATTKPALSAVAAALQTVEQEASALNAQLTQLIQSITIVSLSSLQSTLAAAAHEATGAVALSIALNNAYVATGQTGPHPDANKLLANFLQATDMVVKLLTRRLTEPVAPGTAQAALIVAANDPVLGVVPLIATLQVANSALVGNAAAIQLATTYYSAEPTHPDIIMLQAAFLKSAHKVVLKMTQRLTNPVAPDTVQAALAAANDQTTGAQAMIQILQSANNALTGNIPALAYTRASYSALIPHPAIALLNAALAKAQVVAQNQLQRQQQQTQSVVSSPVSVSTAVHIVSPVPVSVPAHSPVPVPAQTLTPVPAPVPAPALVAAPVVASVVTPAPVSVPSPAPAPTPAPVPVPVPVPVATPVPAPAQTSGSSNAAVQAADQVVLNLANQLTNATNPVSQQNALNAANDPVVGATPAIAALNAAFVASGGTAPHPDVAMLTNAMIAVATALAAQSPADE